MTNKQFNLFIKKSRREQDNIIRLKGYDYTQGNADRLHNFKFVSRLIGLSPIQVWSVYWLKHIFAICTFVNHGGVKSEDITSRFMDEANYNLLGQALLEERASVHRKRRNKDRKKALKKKKSLS